MMYKKAQQERYIIAAEWLKNRHLAKNSTSVPNIVWQVPMQ